MRKQAIIMGMPVNIDIADRNATVEEINEVLAYFHYIDKTFSVYKNESEITKINRGELKRKDYSKEMKKILDLAKITNKQTGGYFDIRINGILDPSGLVKGYAILQGAKILKSRGHNNFFVEIAGDAQIYGKDNEKKNWRIGIQNPFNTKEIIKIVNLTNKGIATSGNYIRGNHIVNPIKGTKADDIISLTVIGPDVYEADRFATAAFAMGENGIEFIGKLKGFEGYMIKKDKTAVYTSGFEQYVY